MPKDIGLADGVASVPHDHDGLFGRLQHIKPSGIILKITLERLQPASDVI
jgi:hypothetical protein